MNVYPHHVQGQKCSGCDERIKAGSVPIQKLFYIVKNDNPFIHCSWVYRDEADQEASFNSGASKLHYPNSAHNKTPSQAVDIFQINVLGQAIFDPVECARVSAKLKSIGITHRWGGDFKSLGDSGHFEID